MIQQEQQQGTELPNSPMKLTATFATHGVLRPPCLLRMAAAYWSVLPSLRSGRMRELSRELLVSPPLRFGENQEFEQMPLRGPAQLAHSAYGASSWGSGGRNGGPGSARSRERAEVPRRGDVNGRNIR